MLEMYRAILEGLRKYPLATVCAILLGVVGHLWLNNDSLRNKIEAKDAENLDNVRKCSERELAQERKCNSVIDSILRAELRKTEALNKEMEQIIKKVKKK